MEEIFREICQISVEPDGLEFKHEQAIGSPIKEKQQYEGVRIKLPAFLSGTRTQINLQIDIGFGDAVTPRAMEVEFPTILSEFPPPSLRVYSRETAIAEKFQAMVKLEIANSRMKDFYDVWYLAQNFEFQGEQLRAAIQATFDRRKTRIPQELPLVLTSQFYNQKQTQWNAFVSKTKLNINGQTFAEVVSVLKDFLMPPCLAAANGESFEKNWDCSQDWH